MWNRLRFIRFLQVSQIFQRRKSDTNKQDFENKLNLTCHAQSTPKTTGFLTKVFSTSGPNLVALAWTVDELSREQAQNGVNFDFEVKFYLEGQGQSPPKTIGILTKVFYTYGPNLVIIAWTGDELSRGQTWWRTDWRTDGRTQATTIPEGQYWPRVKINCIYINEQVASIFSFALRFGAGATFWPSIFRHSRQANSVFDGPKFPAGGPKFPAGGPKFCTSSLICSKFWLVHLGVRDASRR